MMLCNFRWILGFWAYITMSSWAMALSYTAEELLILARTQRAQIANIHFKMKHEFSSTKYPNQMNLVQHEIWMTPQKYRDDYVRIRYDDIPPACWTNVIGLENDYLFHFTPRPKTIFTMELMAKPINLGRLYQDVLDARGFGMVFNDSSTDPRQYPWYRGIDQLERHGADHKVLGRTATPHLIDGRTVYEVAARLDFGSKGSGVSKLWIDPDLQFSVIRFETIHNGKIAIKWESSKFQPSPSIVFPTELVYTGFDKQGNIYRTSSMILTDVQINQPIPDTVFRLEGLNIPKGTLIEKGHGTAALVWDGEKLVQEQHQSKSKIIDMDGSVVVARVVPELPPSQRHWYWLGGTLLLGAMLLGYGVLRRVRRAS